MRMAYLKQIFNITILTLSFGLVPAFVAHSHEVLPSIADITLDRKSINVEMRWCGCRSPQKNGIIMCQDGGLEATI